MPNRAPVTIARARQRPTILTALAAAVAVIIATRALYVVFRGATWPWA
jgi:hypothetical protein